MQIVRLSLKNFRNHKYSEFKFTEETTAIIGPNAAGKSNILEAITLLSSGKSIRAQKEEELINFDEEACYLNADINNGEDQELAVTLVKNQYGRLTKQFTVNGVKRRPMDFIGNFTSVLFAPQDLELVIDSPSIRREYINNTLSQVDKEYRQRLTRYENAIRRRNKVLHFVRERKARASDLDIWDYILVETGKHLIWDRTMFFTALNGLNEHFPNTKWGYVSHEITQEKLDTNRARDIDAAQTLSGPHRDDFVFYDEERNLAHFGSRGEQRIAVLALKLAELSFIASKIGQRPILLLDDIFSELDGEHRHTVLSLLGKQQTIITGTEEDYIEKAYKKEVTLITL